MKQEWQPNPKAREARVERLQFRRVSGLTKLRVRVFRSEVWRMTDAGRESVKCEHSHSTASSARKCAETTAGQMNRAERKAAR